MEYKGYTARVEFDADASVMFGEVEGLRDVVTFEATDVKQLERAFHDSVDDYLEMCERRGRGPEKPYSGKFLVRVDPKLHRDIAMAAARAGKSLNAFVGEAVRQWIAPSAAAATRALLASEAHLQAAAEANAIDAGEIGAAARRFRPYRSVEQEAVVVEGTPVEEARPRAPMRVSRTPGSITTGINAPANRTPPMSRTPEWAAIN